ncbi:Orn/DAP/Arg decarboxylase 2 N-terminal domain-containing protein [Stackebrandtia soli]
MPVTINVESVHELRRLDLIARRHHRVAPIALRINRATGTLTGSHRMTGTPTPFGIDESQLSQAIALTTQSPGVRLTGLHLHSVSNNLDAAAHVAFVADSLAYAALIADEHRLTFDTVNVGGGIGVDPTGAAAFDLDEFSRLLPEADMSGPRVVYELGRYLTAEIGWYAAEVIDIKHTHDRTFAVLRGGTHHFRLPAAWGYSHPATVIEREDWPYPWPRPELVNATVDVTGELCTPRDVLARGLHVDRLRIGDILVFDRCGAYGWTISHHDFLNHPHPTFIVL